MNNNSLFSIIIPVYNVEKYLEKCVASVIAQTFQDYEIILVDDGSVDNSSKLCDALKKKDKRIRIIHKKNGGSSSARNAGLNIASGKYILFIDSDDYWCDIELLKKLADRQNQFHEDIILLGCKIVYEDGTEQVTRSNYDFQNLDQYNKNKILMQLYKTNNFPGSAWIYAIKKSVVDNNNLRFRVGVTAEDYEWIISTIEYANGIGAIDGVHYVYVKRNGSITDKPKLSSIHGLINAIDCYLGFNHRYIAIDKFLARCFLLAVMSYNKMPIKDKKMAVSILCRYTSFLQVANQNVYYYFIKLFGLKLSSFAIRVAYSIIR